MRSKNYAARPPDSILLPAQPADEFLRQKRVVLPEKVGTIIPKISCDLYNSLRDGVTIWKL